MMYRIRVVLTVLVFPLLCFGQLTDKQSFDVDSVLSKMTLQQKVGQLFMVAAYSNQGIEHQREVESLARTYHIGGVIMMQGGPKRQLHFLQRLHNASSLPLLVGQDAEWGQAMRLDSTYKFPTSLTVGAANDIVLTKDLGKALAFECKRVGVHISFSPVLDVNTNPTNPIIGARSFGSTVQGVSAHGIAQIQGLQGSDVLACGKHFPGHGDTQQDSHKALPKVDRSLAELKQMEWVPFKAAVDHGVGSIMIAHLNIPSLEPSGKPTSLSKKVITEVLKNQWNFKGLIITDALNMKGVSEYASPGKLEVEAFKAGNDILLFPMNVPAASKGLMTSFTSGELSIEELDRRVKKILIAKSITRSYVDWNLSKKFSLETTLTSLNQGRRSLNEEVSFKIIAAAATALPNGTAAMPIKELDQKFIHISLGDLTGNSIFEAYLDRYKEMSHFTGSDTPLDTATASDVIIVSFHQNTKNPWKRYKLNASEFKLISELSSMGKSMYVVHFANPYGILTYPSLKGNQQVISMYENNHVAQLLAPQFLFGARAMKGILPVDLGTWGKAGDSRLTQSIQRLKYGRPFEVGLSEAPLDRIDSTMSHAIKVGATPGGQILVARRGNVVYQKSFGTHTYGGKDVGWKDLYDLASITKITATLPGIMHWYEKQPLLLKTTLGNHTNRLAGSDKENLVIEDVLAHQSGLPAWIPFYLKTIKTDSIKDYWYTDLDVEGFVRIRPEMSIRTEVRDTMFSMLAKSELSGSDYRYSDLGYYLFQEMLEERFNEPLDQWVTNTIYAPLGAQRLTYTPLKNGFLLDEIVPSEEDSYWRNSTVHGTVHDMGAAMLGGVAGHAGLFANSNDLGKMMQMYLNRGIYGGVRFFQPSTIDKFSSCAFCEYKNRRGLGFDRPQEAGTSGPSCSCASENSFGHTGFTGTMVWMDPKEDLLYIFLSNRTFPDMENWKLSKLDVRTNIQEFIYDAMH